MFESLAWAMGPGGGGEGGGGGLTAFLPLVAIFAIFYFLMIRPQQKKAKAHKEMLSAVQKGDVIVTQGGIQGKVTGVTDQFLTVEIAEKVRVKVARNFISAKITAGQAPPDPTEKK
jgi:preprotein translocase subunit YajC